jgi:WD40 repeat protein
MSEDSAQQEHAPQDKPTTPYVGLVPYAEDDAAFFFGRDDVKRIVAGNLRASGLTLLYGASGVGKTSLLRAGVIHDLRKQMRETAGAGPERASFAVCAFAAWRDDPLPALLETIRLAAVETLGAGDLPRSAPGTPVVEALRAWTERVRTLLVVLDQFEDYFLYHPDEEGEETFAGEFPAIVNDSNLRVHFLVAIREDALAKLDRFKGHIPRLFTNYVRVEHLDRGAARRAIEGPVEEWNRRSRGEPPYTLEPGLVEAVIDAAASGGLALGRIGADTDTAPDGERVEAPFLQLVMERLWGATVKAGSRDLTLSRLERLGGPQRIVENHLLEALAALSQSEQALAADLFRFLVTRSKTKIAHPASDLSEWTGHPEADVTDVLDKLCRGESGRILRRVPPPPTGDNGATSYELFHDLMAEPILEWRREYEQERRRRAVVRRFARIGGSLLLLVAVFATVGIWALVQRSEAQSATRAATSFALASTARAQLAKRSDTSLLLGLEAYRASPTADAASAMVEALEAARRSGAEMILRGGMDGVRAIAFSPDGRTLAGADFDGGLRLWDTEARTPLGEPLRGHEGEVWGLAFSPDRTTLASSGFDGTVRLWDARDGRPVGEPITIGRGAARSVSFSPDGTTIAVAADDDTVRLLDVGSRRQVGRPLRGHEREVVSVAFSPDGSVLASAGYDRTVRLWDVRTRTPLGELRGHAGEVWSVSFSPDGRLLASAGYDGTVRLWDVKTREPLGPPLSGDTGQVWSVAFSPDGRTLAASGFDGTVRLWDTRTREPLGDPLRGHARGVISVAFRSDGVLASSSYDGTVRLWNLDRQGRFGEALRGHTDRVKAVAFVGEATLASGGFDGTIRLWDASARRAIGRLGRDRLESVESIAFSQDGGTLASAHVDGSIRLWRLPARTPIGELRGHEGAVQSVTFGDRSTLGSTGFDGSVRLWDLPGLKSLGAPLLGHDGPVWSVSFDGDGRTLASVGSDGTLRLWNPHSDQPRETLPLPASDVALSVAFAPDRDTLATGHVGGLVQLWDVRTRELLGEPLRGHTGRVESVSFSPNGRTLASASDDGTVRLWDVHGRRSLGKPLHGHRSSVFGVAFSPDGRTIASGGEDQAVRLWEGILWRDLADLEAQVCDLVVGNLTKSEWEELVPGLKYRTTCAT